MYLQTTSYMTWRGPGDTSLQPKELAGGMTITAAHTSPGAGAAASPTFPGAYKQSPLGCGRVWKPRLQGRKGLSKHQPTPPLGVGSSLTMSTAQVATTQPNYFAWKRHLHFTNVLTWLGVVHRSFLYRCSSRSERPGQHEGSGHKDLFWKENLGRAIYPL